MKEGSHLGPLFDKIQFDRVQNMISVGIDEGATILCGGLGRPDGVSKGWFVKPKNSQMFQIICGLHVKKFLVLCLYNSF